MASKIRPHTRIDNTVFDLAATIGPHAFTIYCFFQKYENRKNGRCNPSLSTLEKVTGFARNTIIKYIGILEEYGLIKTRKKHHTSNQYDLKDFFTGDFMKPLRDLLEQGRQFTFKGSAQKSSSSDALKPGSPDKPQHSPSELGRTKENTPEIQGETDTTPTLKQQVCSHPEDQQFHPEPGITICCHCYLTREETKADAKHGG